MTNSRYRILLRLLYGKIIESKLSTSELRSLVEELRRGRLADELAFMINFSLQHFDALEENSRQAKLLSELDRIIRQRKFSKTAVANMMSSLGFQPTSRETMQDMLERFIEENSVSRIEQLLKLLSSDQAMDGFLSGIDRDRS